VNVLKNLSEGLNARSVEELAARSDATVLIVGPTGTGKTTLAKRIHVEGKRAKGPFVTVNLASLHEATIESTLFGHERGAFTGADRPRMGRLELADGGTLFFDEIGELSLPLQARLLEFLQTRTLTPLGSNRERRVDVRVICATNRNLENDVREGRFREDFLHRIRVLKIELDSIASVTGEVLSATIHEVLETICLKNEKTIRRISREAAELFECYSWPGNYRELESVLEVAVLTSEDDVIDLDDLPRWFIEQARTGIEYRLGHDVSIRADRGGWNRLGSAEVPLGRNFTKTVEKFESAVLKFYIDRNRGCLAKAAREAGLPKATFYRKAQNYHLLRV
jgi:DNA-binding NtrC family response regulator